MSSISGTGPSNSHYVSHRDGGVARVRSRAESTESSLTLKVRTSEGDTVELSFDAISLRQLESGTARSGTDKASYARASQSDSFNFDVKINGDLNDQEVADITSLIQSLASGGSSASPLSSLAAYAGAFTQTSSVTNTKLRLYA